MQATDHEARESGMRMSLGQLALTLLPRCCRIKIITPTCNSEEKKAFETAFSF